MKNKELSRREIILKATLDIIYEETISATHFRTISERTGFSLGNIHYYFKTKEELFSALMDYMIDMYIAEQHKRLESRKGAPGERLNFLIEHNLAYIKRRKDMVVLKDFCVAASKNREIRKKVKSIYDSWHTRIREIIDEGIRVGEFTPKYRDIMPSLLTSIVEGVAQQYLVDDENLDLDAYFETVSKILSDLLNVPK